MCVRITTPGCDSTHMRVYVYISQIYLARTHLREDERHVVGRRGHGGELGGHALRVRQVREAQAVVEEDEEVGGQAEDRLDDAGLLVRAWCIDLVGRVVSESVRVGPFFTMDMMTQQTRCFHTCR